MTQAANINKERASDRTLVLEPIPGQKVLNTTGLVDKRLFSGDGSHQLHAVKHPVFDLWRFRYEKGILPEPLKQNFTSFSQLKRFADAYFGRRGLQIAKVID